jgi:hypothetical protein
LRLMRSDIIAPTPGRVEPMQQNGRCKPGHDDVYGS